MKKSTRLLSLLLVLVLCLSVLPVGAAAAGTTGWKRVMGDWYYYENGSPAMGWRKISGSWYYFVPDWGGIMCTGWMNTDPTYYSIGEGPFTGDWYHFSSSGKMEHDKWIKRTLYDKDNNSYNIWFYALSSGKFAKGWQKIGGSWYYFDPDDCVMLSGGILDLPDKNGNIRYYWLTDSGALFTGWKRLSGTDGEGGTLYFWAYFTSNGAVENGWKKIDGSWFYFDDFAMLADGVYEIDGGYYYFKPGGAMATGWQSIGGEYYYFKSSGAMTTSSWLKSGGKWYYLKSDGVMAANETLNIGGTDYKFNAGGAWVS